MFPWKSKEIKISWGEAPSKNTITTYKLPLAQLTGSVIRKWRELGYVTPKYATLREIIMFSWKNQRNSRYRKGSLTPAPFAPKQVLGHSWEVSSQNLEERGILISEDRCVAKRNPNAQASSDSSSLLLLAQTLFVSHHIFSTTCHSSNLAQICSGLTISLSLYFRMKALMSWKTYVK